MGYDYHGNASEWKRYINSALPTVGAVVVFKKNHVAIVEDIKFNIEIVEQNWLGWGIVSTRSLDMFDNSIAGYIDNFSKK